MSEHDLDNIDNIRSLVNSAFISNNSEYLAHMLHKLLTEYKELATIATEGSYNKTWKHRDVLNFVTYGEKNGP